MFVVQRSDFRLTRRLYVFAFLIGLLLTGGPAWIGALMTMHVHFGRQKARVPQRDRNVPT
jgi:hypothetical protein